MSEMIKAVESAAKMEREIRCEPGHHNLDSPEYKEWRHRYTLAENATKQARNVLASAIYSHCPVATINSNWSP